jgi:pSer/pThr/pTyr-binding forkhead associated (FHA) protein
MKPKLIDLGAAGGLAREISLTNDEFLLGRGEDCDLAVRDPEVSRHHCMIRVRGNDVTVSDLGSSNGTFVNNHRVVSQMNLRTGDELRLGQGRFLVDLGDDPDFRIPQEAIADPLLATRQIRDIKDVKPPS